MMVPSTLDLMNSEILCDLTRCETDINRCNLEQHMLDSAFNVYNYVKKFGVDRTLLSIYNKDGSLNKAIGFKFPSCESVNAISNPYTPLSRTFIAAMEEEGEGIFAKIIKFIKFIWQKIKDFFSTIWKKIKAFFGFNVNKFEKESSGILGGLSKATKGCFKSLKQPVTLSIPFFKGKSRMTAVATILGSATGAVALKKLYDHFSKSDESEDNIDDVSTENVTVTADTDPKEAVGWINKFTAYFKEMFNREKDIDKTQEQLDKINPDKVMKDASNGQPAQEDFQGKLDKAEQAVKDKISEEWDRSTTKKVYEKFAEKEQAYSDNSPRYKKGKEWVGDNLVTPAKQLVHGVYAIGRHDLSNKNAGKNFVADINAIGIQSARGTYRKLYTRAVGVAKVHHKDLSLGMKLWGHVSACCKIGLQFAASKALSAATFGGAGAVLPNDMFSKGLKRMDDLAKIKAKDHELTGNTDWSSKEKIIAAAKRVRDARRAERAAQNQQTENTEMMWNMYNYFIP